MATANLLTDAVIRALKPSDKVQRHNDGDGLSLIVKPNGAKLWRYRYHFQGIEKNLSLGAYPVPVSLAKARTKRDALKVDLDNEINPADARKQKIVGHGQTFEVVAREWLELHKSQVSENSYLNTLQRFEAHVLPVIGNRPIADLTSMDILDLLRKIEKKKSAKGKPLVSTAHECQKEISRVFRLAVRSSRAKINVAADLGKKDSLTQVKTVGHAAVTDETDFAKMLTVMDTHGGRPQTMYALRLLPHLMLRPSEMRLGEWSEINWDLKVWAIPGARMKKRKHLPHLVPLSRQVLAMLKALKAESLSERFLFPHQTKVETKCMSHRTLGKALELRGYGGLQSQHGFRKCASTILNDRGCDDDVIELCLAHVKGGKDPGGSSIKRIYDLSPEMGARVKLMQTLSDTIDELKSSVKKPKLRLVA